MSTELEFVQGLSALFSQLDKYSFYWDEIPGKGNKELVDFLAYKFGTKWVRSAIIEKIDSHIIKASTEKNTLSLKLNKKNTDAILEIDDGRTDRFKAELVNNKLKIHLDPLKSPLGATAYYTFLITRFPTNFKTIFQEAKKVMGSNINQGRLRTSRDDLLELGFISEVLPVHNQDIDIAFDREAFLPISPELVWQDNVEKLDGIISPNGIEQKFELVKELQNIYNEQFGDYGIRINGGSITVFHSSQWLLYHLAYNIKGNENIRMLLGSLGSFEEPYIKYYENMLKTGLKTKIIYDPSANAVGKRISNIMKLKEDYPLSIEIGATPLSHGTSRRMIYDNMAIDGKKLMEFNSDLSYISTIYLQDHIIARMRENFDKAFLKSMDQK